MLKTESLKSPVILLTRTITEIKQTKNFINTLIYPCAFVLKINKIKQKTNRHSICIV